jgi:glutathione synthase/RimK-type ligase-like ATP-grasp enzyme
VIYKTLSGGSIDRNSRHDAIYTVRLTKSALKDLDRVRVTPCLFQAWVEKAFEVRATIVGQRVFAARIDALSEQAKVDFRRDYGALRYSEWELPDQVVASLRRLLDSLDLSYGAVDLAVTEDLDYVFLEVNPDGAWGWIEQHTGLPIADALADLLVGDIGAGEPDRSWIEASLSGDSVDPANPLGR